MIYLTPPPFHERRRRAEIQLAREALIIWLAVAGLAIGIVAIFFL